MSHVFTEITSVAAMFGCVCMAFVCIAQLGELFAAARPRTRRMQPWELQHAPNRFVASKL